MNTMELKIPAGHFNCKAVLSMLNINFNTTLIFINHFHCKQLLAVSGKGHHLWLCSSNAGNYLGNYIIIEVLMLL